MTRKYGRLPRQVHPYVVDIYDVIKKYTNVSPYVVMGEMFGISRQRAQQVVIEERKRQEREAAARAVIDSEQSS